LIRKLEPSTDEARACGSGWGTERMRGSQTPSERAATKHAPRGPSARWFRFPLADHPELQAAVIAEAFIGAANYTLCRADLVRDVEAI
jgi:hypothetical protein